MLIVHRCLVCKHNDLESHTFGNGENCRIRPTGLAACCTTCEWGPSELIPTWTEDGKLATAIHKPGEKWNPEWIHKIIPCDCDQCFALYTQLVPDNTAEEEIDEYTQASIRQADSEAGW